MGLEKEALRYPEHEFSLALLDKMEQVCQANLKQLEDPGSRPGLIVSDEKPEVGKSGELFPGVWSDFANMENGPLTKRIARIRRLRDGLNRGNQKAIEQTRRWFGRLRDKYQRLYEAKKGIPEERMSRDPEFITLTGRAMGLRSAIRILEDTRQENVEGPDMTYPLSFLTGELGDVCARLEVNETVRTIESLRMIESWLGNFTEGYNSLNPPEPSASHECV